VVKISTKSYLIDAEKMKLDEITANQDQSTLKQKNRLALQNFKQVELPPLKTIDKSNESK